MTYFNDRIVFLQGYNSRQVDEESGEPVTSSTVYGCPWAGRCACPVRFRVIKSPNEVHLFAHGKHTAESHSQDHSVRGLKLPQKAALEAAVRVQPMATGADLRRSLNLLPLPQRDEVRISPAKNRSVVREVSKMRKDVLSEFGEHVDRKEGSLTRLCDKMFIKNLVPSATSCSASSCCGCSLTASRELPSGSKSIGPAIVETGLVDTLVGVGGTNNNDGLEAR